MIMSAGMAVGGWCMLAGNAEGNSKSPSARTCLAASVSGYKRLDLSHSNRRTQYHQRQTAVTTSVQHPALDSINRNHAHRLRLHRPHGHRHEPASGHVGTDRCGCRKAKPDLHLRRPPPRRLLSSSHRAHHHHVHRLPRLCSQHLLRTHLRHCKSPRIQSPFSTLT